MKKTIDVMGLGSALMDFLVEVDDNTLMEFDLKKGEMHLVDQEKTKSVLQKIKDKNLEIEIIPGGCASNTLKGIALLGGHVIFCGAVGKDEHGEIYEQEIQKLGVQSKVSPTPPNMTGHAVTFITPDSERTMATHLGAAITLQKQDVFEEDIVKSKVIYLTGYVLEAPNLREAALHAISIAKENNVKVAIDLADPELIRRNIDDLRKIVNEHADILFLNESEAEVFSGVGAEEAVHKVAENVEIAIVKLGKKGALVKSGSDVYNVQGHVVDAVDTTGAGDLFAAGFLYAFTQGKSLDKCAASGNLVASKIVQQIGAKLEYSIKEEIDKI